MYTWNIRKHLTQHCLNTQLIKFSSSGTPKKSGMVYNRLTKTLTLFITKIYDFP